MAVDLGKQYGPLPLGAWIIVIGGGLGIAWYSKRAGSGEPEIVEDTGSQPGVGDGSVGGWVPQQPPTTPTTDPKDAVTNNDQWYTYISRELVGRFNYDPVLVDSALSKYLAGMQSKLSVSEWVIVRAALSIMPPPNAIPPDPGGGTPPPVKPPVPPVVKPPPVIRPPTRPPVIVIPKPPTSVPKPVVPKPPPPKPKPPPPKPAYRYYKVRSGDNLWNIAKKYYGNGAKYGVIFDANRSGKTRRDGKKGMISNPSLIHPNWVLLIP